jgi:NAD(P)-dependent dehydrogenase (short-subunit alcohol dehydrogenase family)
MFVDSLFAGKKFLVTGGGTGLGKAMAERFLGLGAEIRYLRPAQGRLRRDRRGADESALNQSSREASRANGEAQLRPQSMTAPFGPNPNVCKSKPGGPSADHWRQHARNV